MIKRIGTVLLAALVVGAAGCSREETAPVSPESPPAAGTGTGQAPGAPAGTAAGGPVTGGVGGPAAASDAARSHPGGPIPK